METNDYLESLRILREDDARRERIRLARIQTEIYESQQREKLQNDEQQRKNAENKELQEKCNNSLSEIYLKCPTCQKIFLCENPETVYTSVGKAKQRLFFKTECSCGKICFGAINNRVDWDKTSNHVRLNLDN